MHRQSDHAWWGCQWSHACWMVLHLLFQSHHRYQHVYSWSNLWLYSGIQPYLRGYVNVGRCLRYSLELVGQGHEGCLENVQPQRLMFFDMLVSTGLRMRDHIYDCAILNIRSSVDLWRSSLTKRLSIWSSFHAHFIRSLMATVEIPKNGATKVSSSSKVSTASVMVTTRSSTCIIPTCPVKVPPVSWSNFSIADSAILVPLTCDNAWSMDRGASARLDLIPDKAEAIFVAAARMPTTDARTLNGSPMARHFKSGRTAHEIELIDLIQVEGNKEWEENRVGASSKSTSLRHNACAATLTLRCLQVIGCPSLAPSYTIGMIKLIGTTTWIGRISRMK